MRIVYHRSPRCAVEWGRVAVSRLRRQFLLRSSFALVLAWFGALACDGGSPTDPPGGTGEPATLVVTPDSLAFAALGDSAQLAGVARDSAGNPIPGVVVVWTNTDPAVATVSPTGWVVASGNGTAAVVASAGTLADTVPVTVAQAGAGVEASPASIELYALGDSVRLTARVRDAKGNEVADATVLWASLDPGVATVRQSGWVVASDNGTAGVVASAGGVADTAEVEVAQVAAAVELIPDVDARLPLRLAQDETLQLDVVVTDSNDVAFETPAVEWASTAPPVAAVDAAGLVTALRGGVTVVSARVDGVSDEAAITVLDRLAFVSDRDGDYEIYVMNADGTGQTNITNQPGARDWNPAWSPDGTRIAFVRRRDGDPEVYVMNADGSGQTNLSNDDGADRAAVWSPDGTKIAFTSTRDGNHEIYVVNADGGGLENLTTAAGDDLDPAWSPDGTRIAFSSNRDGNYEIYVMNPDGSGQINITKDGDLDALPRWSPDGTKILFESTRDGNREIYVMDAVGGGPNNLTEDSGTDDVARWSPDGTKILFATDRDGNYEIYVANADGSDPVNRTYSPGVDSDPAWFPDGTKITYVTAWWQGNQEIYVVDATGLPLTSFLTDDPADDFSPVWRPRP